MTVMAVTAMALVSFSAANQRTSYALNNQVALRYASEAAIEEAKLRLIQDKNSATPGTWYIPLFKSGLSASDLASYAANPTSGPYTAVRPTLRRIFGSGDIRQIQVDVFFDKTASANGFVARAVSYVLAEGAKYTAGMKLNFTYEAVTTQPPGMASFSKYSLFIDQWDPSLWFSHERYDGYVHSNGDVKFMYKDARFFEDLTYVGNKIFYNDPAWTQAEKDALFPGGATRLASPISMPSFASIQTDLLPAAQAGPAELYVDPAAPGPWSGATIDRLRVTFAWDNNVKQNYAYLQSLDALGNVTRTVKYSVPKNGTDTLIYSKSRVELKGVVQGRVSVATESTGDTISAPSVKITDDVVYVDDQGRPKMWTYAASGAPLPASGRSYFSDPVTSQTFNYSFTGIPSATNPTADNINTRTYLGTVVNWDQANFKFQPNPDYAHTFKDPVLGVMTSQKVVISKSCPYNTMQMWAMYSENDTYEVEQDTTSRGNMGKYGSLTVKTTPMDAVMYMSGWTGYGRQLPHLYDRHMLTNPPPYFVRIPDAGPASTTVTVSFGATYFGK